ncbi:MAG: hypothetical protein GY739_21120 [Mesoflavibacter sp.]|nr:hypothetical protein [Mesoflavibacter sp.]
MLKRDIHFTIEINGYILFTIKIKNKTEHKKQKQKINSQKLKKTQQKNNSQKLKKKTKKKIKTCHGPPKGLSQQA